MQQNDDTLTVDWLLPDGRGGGSTSSGTFKARGVLPGDQITPVASSKKGRVLEIEQYDTTHLSTRVAHPCPVVDRCGGCDLAHSPADARQQSLITMVQRALRVDLVPEWIQPETSWRSRVKLAVNGQSVGFHAPRSHELVPIEGCQAAHPLISAEISHLLENGAIAGTKTIELRTDGRKVVAVLDKGKIGPNDLPRLEHVAVNGRAVRGVPTLELAVAGLALRASPLSFFQVNAPGNARLVQRILANVRRVAPERVMDLYAGIGNLTLPIAATGVPTVAVELEGQATKDLRFNATRAGLSIEVHTSAVEKFDTTVVPFDMAVLDPPRAGAPGVVKRLLMHRPKAVQFVSCHVPSAARDLQPLLRAGYRITDLAVVDLFAPTHHIETLVLLERS